MIYQDVLVWANRNKKRIQTIFLKLKKLKNTEVDSLFHAQHQPVFDRIDCLQCANCCKTISPIILQKDVERIAPFLRMKPHTFIEKYCTLDDDKDYVFNSSPCPFLSHDNYCAIYEVRPKACAEYPHTNHKPMKSILTLTQKNAETCPAVVSVLQQIENSLKRY